MPINIYTDKQTKIINTALSNIRDTLTSIQNQLDYINEHIDDILAVSDNLTAILSLNEQALKKDGSVGMEADFNVNGHKLVNLLEGTTSTDAVRKSQLDTTQSTLQSNIDTVQSNLDTHTSDTNNPHSTTLEQVRAQDNKISGDIDANNHQIKNLALPVDNTDAARHGDVAQKNLSNITSLGKILDLDGSGSGLDADKVRGLPADFTCSKAGNGYTKLPNGIIIQWGYNTTGTITLPVSFTTAYRVTGSLSYNTTTAHDGISIWNTTLSSFDMYYGDGNAHYVDWIAIGY